MVLVFMLQENLEAISKGIQCMYLDFEGNPSDLPKLDLVFCDDIGRSRRFYGLCFGLGGI